MSGIAAGRGPSVAPGSDPPLVPTPPAADCEAVIVVPVRDEEQTVGAALAALAAQTDLAGLALDHRRFEVIVLANNCRDGSAAVARAVARRHPTLVLHVVERTLPPEQTHVGAARRLAMNEAVCRLVRIGRDRGVIASTDGDSRVAATWLAATLREAEQGADAVCGRILTPPSAGVDPDRGVRLYLLRDAAYRLLVAELEAVLDPDPADPWPRHHQHYGASFAVTATAYRRIGGVPAVATLEDVALHAALRRADARIRHSPAVRVWTSARRDGRVAIGLSTQLNEWAAMAAAGTPLLVEPVPTVAARLRARRRLRLLWHRVLRGDLLDRRMFEPPAGSLGVAAGWLRKEALSAATFGGLVERVDERRRDDGGAAPLVPIAAAIAELRRTLAPQRGSLVRLAGKLALAPFEEIEPVPLLAAFGQGDERLAVSGVLQEGIVDLVAG